jgi:PPOX class probable F420-dependent enzyme
MGKISDEGALALLEKPHSAVISTLADDGSIMSSVVWVNVEDGELAVNSQVGRAWANNIERDPRVTLLVYDEANAYEYVEIRGRATGTLEDADGHIDRLAKKYMGVDSYPFRQADEQRIKYVIEPVRVRHSVQ